MIGTMFLFVFWPSFNSAFLQGPAAARAAMNTILSIRSMTQIAIEERSPLPPCPERRCSPSSAPP